VLERSKEWVCHLVSSPAQKLEQVPGQKAGDTVDVYAPDHLPLLKVRLISAKVCRHPGRAMARSGVIVTQLLCFRYHT
jgi:hypothetical protein